MPAKGLMAAGLLACIAGALIHLAPPTSNRSAPISRGETHIIELSLPALQFITVTAGQFEIDLTLSVTGPDGRAVHGADRGPYGRETLIFLTGPAGNYSVHLTAAPNGSLRGRYDFQVQEVRAPRPGDEPALEAQRQLVEAVQLEQTANAGAHDRARSLYHSAALLLQSSGFPSLEAQAKSAEGRLLDRAGKRESAYHCYMESLRLREAIRDPHGRLESLLQIGRLSGHLKQKFDFVPDDPGFLAAWQALGDRRGIAHAMSTVSSSFRRRSELQPAVHWAERSVRLAGQLQDPPLEARCLESLVKAQTELGQYDEALRNAERILGIVTQMRDTRGETAAVGLIAHVFLTARRPAEALPYVQRELKLRELDNDPTAVANNHYSLAVLHQQLGDMTRAAEHDEAALALTLQSAGDFFSPKWRTGFLSSYATVEHYFRVMGGSGRIGEALLAADRCRWRAFGGTQDYALHDLLRQFDSNTVLLELWADPTWTTLFVAGPSGVRHHIVQDAGGIAALAARVWGCFATRRTCAGESRDLSRQLLGPVWPLLRGKRIVVSGDGIFSYFPFAALPDPSRDDDRPLILDQEIVHVPCVSALIERRGRSQRSAGAPVEIAILSDPVFDSRDPRLGRAVAALPRLDPELARALELNGLPLEKGAVPRLGFAAAETAAVLAALPPNLPSRVFVGLDARRETLSRPIPKGSLLHIATHGFVNEEDSDFSGLVFSLVDSEGQPRNGYFRLRDLYSLHLPARLVVLSACQTACGRQYSGQPAYSLSSAFLRAGADSVVASGWKVNDESTAEFMRAFYRNLLSSPDLKVPQALRAAQLELRNTPRWSHPYYWAAFSAYGEWR